MTDDDLWEALEGLFAYDTGSVDSGIHDEVLRSKAQDAMRAKSADEKRFFIGRKVRDVMLSEESLSESYGTEDVAMFWQWLDETMNCAL